MSDEQHKTCLKYNSVVFPGTKDLKVGISLNVKGGKNLPINGLRHNPEGDSSGWYIWAGEEFSDDDDFFVPLHIEHLDKWCPEIVKYLALPPGFRFLVGEDDYEDVWFDETLLKG